MSDLPYWECPGFTSLSIITSNPCVLKYFEHFSISSLSSGDSIDFSPPCQHLYQEVFPRKQNRCQPRQARRLVTVKDFRTPFTSQLQLDHLFAYANQSTTNHVFTGTQTLCSVMISYIQIRPAIFPFQNPITLVPKM